MFQLFNHLSSAENSRDLVIYLKYDFQDVVDLLHCSSSRDSGDHIFKLLELSNPILCPLLLLKWMETDWDYLASFYLSSNIIWSCSFLVTSAKTKCCKNISNLSRAREIK